MSASLKYRSLLVALLSAVAGGDRMYSAAAGGDGSKCCVLCVLTLDSGAAPMGLELVNENHTCHAAAESNRVVVDARQGNAYKTEMDQALILCEALCDPSAPARNLAVSGSSTTTSLAVSPTTSRAVKTTSESTREKTETTLEVALWQTEPSSYFDVEEKSKVFIAVSAATGGVGLLMGGVVSVLYAKKGKKPRVETDAQSYAASTALSFASDAVNVDTVEVPTPLTANEDQMTSVTLAMF